jgi:hypothetical protein
MIVFYLIHHATKKARIFFHILNYLKLTIIIVNKIHYYSKEKKEKKKLATIFVLGILRFTADPKRVEILQLYNPFVKKTVLRMIIPCRISWNIVLGK